MRHSEAGTHLEFRGERRSTHDYSHTWESGLSRFIVEDVVNDLVVLQGVDDEPSIKASLSASCLLQPLPGDLVLVHLDDDEQGHFVLAVLKRSAQTARQYCLSANVSLLANDGHLHIMGHSVDLSAAHSKFKVDQFQGIYKDKSEKADTITTVAGLVRHQIDRIISRIRNSFRLIEGLDRTQAANIQQTAEHQILMKSAFTKLNSEHVVKVQAKKIDLG